ncbi:MAG: mechanosensitive ion channel family protein [Hyphomicrobiaceae bacterium]
MDKATRFADGWQVAWSRINGWVDGFFSLLPNLIVGLLVLSIFLLLAFVARGALARSFRNRGREDLGEMLSSFSFWISLLLGTLVALTIILPTLNPGDLVASLGIGSVAIGFAFKDILQNWLAGLLILLRQPFRRGDQIHVGQIEGTVHRINQRATMIRTYDNRIVVVPNADIYTSSITVMTAYAKRRIALDITVGYDHDVDFVSKLVLDTLARLEEVEKSPAPQVICWELGATSLGLKVRWWTRSQRSAEVAGRSRVVQALKEAFQANGIDPTDPQIVLTQQIGPGEQNREDRRERVPAIAAMPEEPPSLEIPTEDPEAEQPKETIRDMPIESAPDG